MTSEERNAIGAIIAGIITFLIFGTRIWRTTASGGYDGDVGLSAWGWDVILLIFGGIGITITTVIVLHVVIAIVTNTPNPEMVADERDRMIAKRGTLATLVVVSTGFMAAVLMLATGWSAVAALNTILLGMALGSFASEFVKIAAYRFGI